MLNPVALSISPTSSTEPRERAREIRRLGGGDRAQHGRRAGARRRARRLGGLRSIFWIKRPGHLRAVVLTALFVPVTRAAPAPARPWASCWDPSCSPGLTYGSSKARRRVGLAGDRRLLRVRGLALAALVPSNGVAWIRC